MGKRPYEKRKLRLGRNGLKAVCGSLSFERRFKL
jgi:hypothetical protein